MTLLDNLKTLYEAGMKFETDRVFVSTDSEEEWIEDTRFSLSDSNGIYRIPSIEHLEGVVVEVMDGIYSKNGGAGGWTLQHNRIFTFKSKIMHRYTLATIYDKFNFSREEKERLDCLLKFMCAEPILEQIRKMK